MSTTQSAGLAEFRATREFRRVELRGRENEAHIGDDAVPGELRDEDFPELRA